MLKKISWNIHRVMFNYIPNIIKNKKIYYIERVIKHFGDDNFINSVLNINRDKNAIRIFFNNNESNSILYYIKIEQLGMGMGAFLRWAIHGLWEAERLSCIPVLEFKGVYNELDEINGSRNMFEYYYEQPCKYSVEDIESSNFFLFDEGTLKRHASFYNMQQELLVGYDINEKYIKDMGEIAKKYLHLNNITKKYINDTKNEILSSNDKVIGVHIRGTDYKLKWINHPIHIEPEQYFKFIDYYLTKGYNKVFLATDDYGYLKKFKMRYNEKLVFYDDVNRGDGNVNIAMLNGNRHNNRYFNGLEVLRDIYTLAECDMFISGLSQVSVVARILNSASEKHYKEYVLINNGLN